MNPLKREITVHYYSEASSTIYQSILKKNKKIRESLSEIRTTVLYNDIYHIINGLYNTAFADLSEGYTDVSND